MIYEIAGLKVEMGPKYDRLTRQSAAYASSGTPVMCVAPDPGDLTRVALDTASAEEQEYICCGAAFCRELIGHGRFFLHASAVVYEDAAYLFSAPSGTGSFTGNGTLILTDSASVKYNKGSIQQISGATTLTYYWDASGLQANTTYGFIIDNLYAPGATATITVNGTAGTKVTNDNGVVNTALSAYRGSSHYPQ